jgi:hypothetical protein
LNASHMLLRIMSERSSSNDGALATRRYMKAANIAQGLQDQST